METVIITRCNVYILCDKITIIFVLLFIFYVDFLTLKLKKEIYICGEKKTSRISVEGICSLYV